MIAQARSAAAGRLMRRIGVRTDWQLKLRKMGDRVRVDLPFGDDWWPYAVRRVGENPRNAWLLARSSIGGADGYGIG